MPQRRIIIPEVGEVLLVKRRGAKNLRLSVTAKGQVRVSMPSWTPYAAGVKFARSRSDWIKAHMQSYREVLLLDGMQIGKAHRLIFKRSAAGSKTVARVKNQTVEVTAPLPFDDSAVQLKARAACDRALRSEAAHLLPQRLDSLAKTHNFSYKQARVRKLTSRWGSCSHEKTISLSIYLMQLPWPLIDYVLLHELTHTEHLNHGQDFWKRFEEVLPNAKNLRKNVRGYKPRLEPS